MAGGEDKGPRHTWPYQISETRTRWDGPRECFLNQFFVYQTQCSGKKRGFSRSHSLDVPHEQPGVLLGKFFMEELDFHVHDRFVAEKVQA